MAELGTDWTALVAECHQRAFATAKGKFSESQMAWCVALIERLAFAQRVDLPAAVRHEYPYLAEQDPDAPGDMQIELWALQVLHLLNGLSLFQVTQVLDRARLLGMATTVNGTGSVGFQQTTAQLLAVLLERLGRLSPDTPHQR